MWDLTLNIVRDSEKRKILGDLTATLVAGFAKILARDAVLGKKMVFEIEDTSTLWKIIYNMQSQSYDIRVVPKEEVAYERWSRGGFECSCKWGLH